MSQPLRALIWTTLAGTVTLVVWGMIFWGVLACPLGVFHELPDAAGVTRALVGSHTTTGTYFMPWPRNTPETSARFLQQHREGPFYRLSYVREGVDPQSPQKLLTGVFHYATVALIAAVLLWVVNPRSRLHCFLTIFLAGCIGSNFQTLGDPIWFHMPWDYTRGVLFYELISWTLLGTVAAAVRRS